MNGKVCKKLRKMAKEGKGVPDVIMRDFTTREIYKMKKKFHNNIPTNQRSRR